MLLKSKANMHMVNNQGLSAIDIARHCNHLEMFLLFLPNNREEENIPLDSVIKSVGRLQKEPMLNPPLTPELRNKSISVDQYQRELVNLNSTFQQRIKIAIEENLTYFYSY